MADKKKHNKTRMEGLGEFFGHIIKGVKSKPGEETRTTHEVKRTVEEEERADGVVLRRTTIEEVELPANHRRPGDSEGSEEENDNDTPRAE